MPNILAENQIEQYQQDGILFPIRVLPPDEGTKYLDALNDLDHRLGGKQRTMKLTQAHFHFRWAYELATHPKILDAVEDLLGPNILVWATEAFLKHPRTPHYISWHQDGTYWNLDSTKVVTAWVALTNSTTENGCMRVVKGSHRQQILPHTETYAQENLLSRGQEVAVEVKEEDATDVVLRAGEMSLHHVNIIHGSNPNRSDEKRVGFATRYTTPEVRQIGERPKAVLARGRDDYHYFELIGPPREMSLEDAVTAMKESAQEHIRSIMHQKQG